MSFWGSSFIFDGKPSEFYDLRIYDFNPSNPAESPAGGNASVYEKWLYRRDKPYFYGRYYDSSLEFDFTVGSFSNIDANTRSAIERWLLGRPTYLPLRIVQDDMTEIVYNVIITQSTHVFVGNMSYALTLHAKCNAPWGFYYPATLGKTYPGGISTESFNYYNSSDSANYNKPTIVFTMDSTGSSTNYFSLTNTTDDGRIFRFDNLTPGEEISVDNDKGIITSSNGSLRMANFNKNFFRLVQGNNALVLAGYITQFTLDAEFARIVGG
jgi:phage-related protein